MAVYLCVMQTSVCVTPALVCKHKYSIRVYNSYLRMIALICHFPSDRHSVLICIQHLRLRMFNAAIKPISDIKCICDYKVHL